MSHQFFIVIQVASLVFEAEFTNTCTEVGKSPPIPSPLPHTMQSAVYLNPNLKENIDLFSFFNLHPLHCYIICAQRIKNN
jgi:hypothetical protein